MPSVIIYLCSDGFTDGSGFMVKEFYCPNDFGPVFSKLPSSSLKSSLMFCSESDSFVVD